MNGRCGQTKVCATVMLLVALVQCHPVVAAQTYIVRKPGGPDVTAFTQKILTNTTAAGVLNELGITGTPVSTPGTPTGGDIVYWNGTSWTRLTAGTLGKFLMSNGPGSPLSWEIVSGEGGGGGGSTNGANWIAVGDEDASLPGTATAEEFQTPLANGGELVLPNSDGSYALRLVPNTAQSGPVNILGPETAFSGLMKWDFTGGSNMTMLPAVPDEDYVAPDGDMQDGTANTQAVGDQDRNIATTAFVDRATRYEQGGSYGSPITSRGYFPTWTVPNKMVFYNIDGEFYLPLITSNYYGKTITIYSMSSSTNTIYPNDANRIVRNGTQQGLSYGITQTGAAGNFVKLYCDESDRWVTLEYSGALALGPGWASVATDNFDSYTHNTDLDAAANWVRENGAANSVIVVRDSGGAGTDSTLVSNQNAVEALHRHNGTFGANQYASFTFEAIGSLDSWGPAVRVQTGAATAYYLAYSTTDATLYLKKMNAGTAATITSTAKTYSSGTKLRIEATGTGSNTRLSVKEDTGSGWVAVWSFQDPGGTYIDGGKPGIMSKNFNTSVHIDDWDGGEKN